MEKEIIQNSCNLSETEDVSTKAQGVQPAVSVAFIKRHEDKTSILLLKHVKCKGLWMMPCGKKEISDITFKDAAIREMKEEIGITLDIDSLNPVSCGYNTYDRIDGVKTFLEQTYYVDFNRLKLNPNEQITNMEPDKATDLKWIYVDNIIENPEIYSTNTVEVATRFKKLDILLNNLSNVRAKAKKLHETYKHSKPILKFFKITEDAIIPEKAHETDSGFDLYSNEDIIIEPGKVQLVHTGIKVGLPAGFEAQVRPKSGLALKSGITVLNTPGTVDEGYTGEVGVILINVSSNPYHVEKGKKIAQLCINKTYQVHDIEVKNENELYDSTTRGEGGFGSTGLDKNK